MERIRKKFTTKEFDEEGTNAGYGQINFNIFVHVDAATGLDTYNNETVTLTFTDGTTSSFEMVEYYADGSPPGGLIYLSTTVLCEAGKVVSSAQIDLENINGEECNMVFNTDFDGTIEENQAYMMMWHVFAYEDLDGCGNSTNVTNFKNDGYEQNNKSVGGG